MVHDESVDALADARRIGVEQRREAEPATGEPAVARERVAEITDTDQRDRAALVQPQHRFDLLDEQRDVVPDATGAVRAEMREILAELRRVHPRDRGEALAGDRVVAAVGEVVQRPEVLRQSGNRGLGQVRKPVRRRDRGRRRLNYLIRSLALAHVTPCRYAGSPPTRAPIGYAGGAGGRRPPDVAAVTFRVNGARRSDSLGACEGVHKSRSWNPRRDPHARPRRRRSPLATGTTDPGRAVDSASITQVGLSSLLSHSGGSDGAGSAAEMPAGSA